MTVALRQIMASVYALVCIIMRKISQKRCCFTRTEGKRKQWLCASAWNILHMDTGTFQSILEPQAKRDLGAPFFLIQTIPEDLNYTMLYYIILYYLVFQSIILHLSHKNIPLVPPWAYEQVVTLATISTNSFLFHAPHACLCVCAVVQC